MILTVYRPSGSQYEGAGNLPVDHKKCRAQVNSGDHRHSVFCQCTNNARFFEKYPKDSVGHDVRGKLGWCKRHAPSEVKKREAAEKAEYDARWARIEDAAARPGRLEKLLKRARVYVLAESDLLIKKICLTPKSRKQAFALLKDIDKELAK